MNIEVFTPELGRRYPFLDDETLRVRLGGIKDEDVAGWAREQGGTREAVYDAFAGNLARAFHEGVLPFAFCDAVMNDLHAVITNADDRRPDLFLRVFSAFDDGEYTLPDKPNEDPVEAYTRPQIASSGRISAMRPLPRLFRWPAPYTQQASMSGLANGQPQTCYLFN